MKNQQERKLQEEREAAMEERSRRALKRKPDFGLYFSGLSDVREPSIGFKGLQEHVESGKLIFN